MRDHRCRSGARCAALNGRCALAAKKKGGSRGFAALGVVPGENRFDHLDNLLLMVARKLADLLEDAPHFADRAGGAARFGGGFAEKLLGGDAERDGKLFDLLRSERDRFAFPRGVTRLAHAELGGELRLGKAGGLAGGEEALAEGSAGTFGRSAGLHGGSIGGQRGSYRLSLHTKRY